MSGAERTNDQIANDVFHTLYPECPAFPGVPNQCDPQMCDCFNADNLPEKVGDAVAALRASFPRAKARPIPKQGSAPVPVDWNAAPGMRVPVLREAPRPKLRIGGEVFFIEVEAGTVYIRHPAWSLVGAGNTLVEAERDLRADASELAEVMASMPRNMLDHDAIDLFEFVLRIG